MLHFSPWLGVAGLQLSCATTYLSGFAWSQDIFGDIDEPLGAQTKVPTLDCDLEEIALPQLENIEDTLGDDHLAALPDAADFVRLC